MHRGTHVNVMAIPPGITFEQLALLNPLQLKVLAENVPYHLLRYFHNEFQLAAVIAKIEHGFAANLDSLEKAIDYFKDHPGLINKALDGLIPAVTMSDLMLPMNSQVFNYVSDAVRELCASLELIIKQPSNSGFVSFDEEGGWTGFAGSVLGDILSQEDGYNVGITSADTSFESETSSSEGGECLNPVVSILGDVVNKVVTFNNDVSVSSIDTGLESDNSDGLGFGGDFLDDLV